MTNARRTASRRPRRVRAGGLALALLVSTPLAAQDPEGFLLTGTVVDAASEAPVQGVRVTIAALGRVLLTDAEGRFTLPALPEGRYAMRLERPGYETVIGDLDVFEDGGFTIEMDPTSDFETGGRLQGVVLDAATGEPVPAVRVRLGEGGPAADTDGAGRFAFRGLDPRTYSVRTEALG